MQDNKEKFNAVPLGALFKKAKSKKKFTYDELAARIGMSTNMVSQIGRGERCPSIPVLIALCNELDINSDYLLAPYLKSSKNSISEDEYHQLFEYILKLKPDEIAIVFDILEAITKKR